MECLFSVVCCVDVDGSKTTIVYLLPILDCEKISQKISDLPFYYGVDYIPASKER
jgi:hypothetical protein